MLKISSTKLEKPRKDVIAVYGGREKNSDKAELLGKYKVDSNQINDNEVEKN